MNRSRSRSQRNPLIRFPFRFRRTIWRVEKIWVFETEGNLGSLGSLDFSMLDLEMGVLVFREAREFIVSRMGILVLIFECKLLTMLLRSVRKINWISELLPPEEGDPILGYAL